MTSTYSAPKPRYSGWEWFKFFAIRTIFPPILLWDLAKLGANRLIGKAVGGLVLPAQKSDFCYEVDCGTDGNLDCKKHSIITHDGATLDTFEVKHTSQTQIIPKYQKYIINFVGNGMCYEQIIDEIKNDAFKLKANIIGFNFRGVGRSIGAVKSKQDLVTDGIAQVQRLLDQGVSPQNIILKGHSLGAGVATLVTQHFHKLGQPINLFNSRSFSSITNFVVGHLRLKRNEYGEAPGQEESAGKKILGWLIKPVIKFGVALAKWEIDAGQAFKSIPEAYRDYIVVRTARQTRLEHGYVDDQVIPHYASIHKAVTSERSKKKIKIDKQIKTLDREIKKSPSQIEMLQKQQKTLIEAREEIKSARKMQTGDFSTDGHNSDWSSLQNRTGQNSMIFFRSFVERTYEDHGVKLPIPRPSI